MGDQNVTSGGESTQVDAPDPFAAALREIVQVLGPVGFGCGDCRCDGCQAEGSEALRIARRALGLEAAS